MSDMEQMHSKAYHLYLAVFFSLLTMSSFCEVFKLKVYQFDFCLPCGGQLLKEDLPSGVYPIFERVNWFGSNMEVTKVFFCKMEEKDGDWRK